MKTKEERNALKEEIEILNRKLSELNEEDLAQIAGGVSFDADGRMILEVGDCFDYVNGGKTLRFRIREPYTVGQTLSSIWPQVYQIIGGNVMYVGYAEISVALLILMTPVGRYEEDGKTKIG